MKFAFLVAEYNPFHNGHAYHIAETRQKSGADAVIAIMSGNFTQRGHPAVIDKYSRAEAAVRCGADCVVELPFPYATGAAPVFATGAVKIAGSLAVPGAGYILSFGSESGNLSALTEAAKILADEPEAFKHALKQKLKSGISYASATAEALLEIGCEQAAKTISGSNDILAVEYLKTLSSVKFLKPLAIKRKGGSEFETATKIRSIIESGKIDELVPFLPLSSYEIITENIKGGSTPDTEILGSLILYKLRSMPLDELSQIFDVQEGLHNRLKEFGAPKGSLEELLAVISTKRYSRSHLNRILLHMLMDLTAAKMEQYKAAVPYVKILALRESRKDILSGFGQGAAHIITRSDDCFSLPPILYDIYNIEKKASEIYALLMKNKYLRIQPQEKMRLIDM